MSVDAPLIRDMMNHALNARTGSSGLFSSFDGFALTSSEFAAGVTPTNFSFPPGDLRRYGAVGNGDSGSAGADDTAAVNAAILSWNGRGEVYVPKGTYRLTSQIIVTTGIRLVGDGCSESNGVGSANRGASCFLRDFAGTSPTFLVTGDDCGIDRIDFDNNTLGGNCVDVWGSRWHGGIISTRNGSNGLRLGQTNAGASNTNTNNWRLDFLLTCGNSTHGLFIDDTNTTTSLSYPLGLSNCNTGCCTLVDARANGGDGIRLGNANDNCFVVVHAEGNAGCGFRFFTDTINSGPRCNVIVTNDCEGNTGNDIQIDAATLPAAAPGLYNRVLGNRSVAVNSRIVDNSTGSLVIQWVPGLNKRAYHFGEDINVFNSVAAGAAGYNMSVGANFSPARLFAVAVGATDSLMRCAVRKVGVGITVGWETNEYAVLKPKNKRFTQPYSASITIDTPTGKIFEITANNGVAFAINAPTNPHDGEEITVQIRNTSGGALGAVTWNAVFKMSAWTQPATNFSRSITFFYNGANWIQESQTGVDVPN